jgi:hypothetical protein
MTQPNSQRYGIENLYLFPLAPEPANNYVTNVAAPHQAWHDPDAKVTYGFKTYTMWDASTATILPAYSYPEWFAATPNFGAGNGHSAPIPMRPLLPNERLMVAPRNNPFAPPGPSDVYIERTDMAVDSGGGTGVAVTGQDTALLTDIKAMLTKIITAMGIS